MEIEQHKNHKAFIRRINFAYVSAGLLVIILVLLGLWRPWSDKGISDRTVDVTGEAKVSAKADEFVFYPTYEFSNADKTTALAQLTKKSDEVVSKLKALGVLDNQIKTNSSGYGTPVYMDTTSKDATYSLQLTIKVTTAEMSQKVQDYLVTTSPTGSISPMNQFSDATRKKLEAEARDTATKDARTRAEQSAKNLGFKIGKVKKISDSGNFCGSGGGVMPMTLSSSDVASSGAVTVTGGAVKEASLSVQPGVDEINYCVSVTYYIH